MTPLPEKEIPGFCEDDTCSLPSDHIHLGDNSMVFQNYGAPCQPKVVTISWDIDNNVPLPYMNPDCRDGKHQACAGDAWNFETDEPIDCMCHCHIKESK